MVRGQALFSEAKNVLGSPSNANCRICPFAVASVVSIAAATGSGFWVRSERRGIQKPCQ